jgi:hypothetical protein
MNIAALVVVVFVVIIIIIIIIIIITTTTTINFRIIRVACFLIFREGKQADLVLYF